MASHWDEDICWTYRMVNCKNLEIKNSRDNILEKPARLGIVSSLYEEYTATYLTESLGNIFALDKEKKNRFQSQPSFVVEWNINVGFIKRIPFLVAPEGDGAQGTDIIFHFPENYYQRNDVMIIERSRQQVIFLSRPIRRSDRDWEIVGKLQDSNYDAVLDRDACQPGMKTRFLTNYQPELHEEGWIYVALFRWFTLL